MKQNFIDEKTGIGYTLHGDYYLPDLNFPEEQPHTIGRFGRARAEFLKKHRRVEYINLLSSGRWNEYLYKVDVEAQEMYERLVAEYAITQGVTEQLKAENQMEWVGSMNNIANAVQEVVYAEVIYR